jgi:uncharacterized protein DUF222/HNH endonuclease
MLRVPANDGAIEALPTERLEQEISELAAHIHAATCRWLMLVGELDRRRSWADWGCRSCAEWLSLQCGVALGSAREQVRVARRLADLPLVREAFENGRLSYSKVRAISRVATDKTESDLLELGLQATAAQLERIVRAYRGAVAVELGQANAAHAERFLSWSWEDDGSLLIRGRLPAEDGALLLRSLEAARDQRHHAETDAGQDVSAETSNRDAPAAVPDDRDYAEPGRSNADALAAVAEASLAAPQAVRSGGERYQVVIHADATVLTADAPDGHCELEHGPALCSETLRRTACDASLVAIVERDGRPLTVGRKQRTVPPALRRALCSRDGCCRFPGCTQRRFVDAHHIQHWAHGGETKLSNLLLLCRHHHRLVHEGGFKVERLSDGGVRFRRPDGRRISARATRLRGHHSEVAHRNRRMGLHIDSETPVALSHGARFSLDMAVEGLLAREGFLSPFEPVPRSPEATDVSAETCKAGAEEGPTC